MDRNLVDQIIEEGATQQAAILMQQRHTLLRQQYQIEGLPESTRAELISEMVDLEFSLQQMGFTVQMDQDGAQ